jgi:hypothetical protein
MVSNPGGAAVRDLSTLVGKLNREIRTAVKEIDDPAAVVADTDRAHTRQGGRHGWCSRDPWADGLSVFHLLKPDSLHSQAPFHPTPRGQAAIAALVEPTVRTRFAQ